MVGVLIFFFTVLANGCDEDPIDRCDAYWGAAYVNRGQTKVLQRAGAASRVSQWMNEG